MAANSIEKNAQTLNALLRQKGKSFGKVWRTRIRQLLQETFEAIHEKPLNGERCLKLQQQIEAELEAVENGTATDSDQENEAPAKKTKKSDKPRETGNNKKNDSVRGTEAASMEAARINDSAAGERMQDTEPATGEVDMRSETTPHNHISKDINIDNNTTIKTSKEINTSNNTGNTQEYTENNIQDTASDHNSNIDNAQTNKTKKTDLNPDTIGLFDLIHIQIRCFFKIRACIRPPYIGKFVLYAENHADSVQSRVDKFLKVLSKGDDDFVAKTEVDVGYRDDLIPDMPGRNLVLHPAKRKK